MQPNVCSSKQMFVQAKRNKKRKKNAKVRKKSKTISINQWGFRANFHGKFYTKFSITRENLEYSFKKNPGCWDRPIFDVLGNLKTTHAEMSKKWPLFETPVWPK